MIYMQLCITLTWKQEKTSSCVFCVHSIHLISRGRISGKILAALATALWLGHLGNGRCRAGCIAGCFRFLAALAHGHSGALGSVKTSRGRISGKILAALATALWLGHLGCRAGCIAGCIAGCFRFLAALALGHGHSGGLGGIEAASFIKITKITTS